MAIEFENIPPKEQIDESIYSDKQTKKRKNKKQKIKKPPLQRLSTVLLTFSIIAVVYGIMFLVSPLLAVLPGIIMWILWFALVATVSCTTLFLIWFSEGWRNFNKSFMDLNNNIFSAGENIIPTLISIYPYVASFFGLTLAGGIILNAIGKKKYPERKSFFKKRLVLSIILTCVFAVFVVFDIFFFVKTI